MSPLSPAFRGLTDGNLSNNNGIAFLTGVPSTIRTLLISSNCLSDLTSFAHLRNLESLDISHNQLESVSQLACLPHLRDLKADHNKIKDLGGLVNLDGLVRLSLKGNRLESIDFGMAKWYVWTFCTILAMLLTRMWQETIGDAQSQFE